MISPLTRLLGLIAVCGMLVSSPAMGEDHRVSSDALSSLGLGEMRQATDARGLHVRGHGSYASVGGGSWAFGGITVHTPLGTWSQGGIDADTYSDVAKTHVGTARVSATPRGAVVRIPQMEVVIEELDSAGNLLPVGRIRLSGGVAAGNSALNTPRTTTGMAGTRRPMVWPSYGW